jgi:hypothetical protein
VTTPVTDDDIVSGAASFLLGFQAAVNAVDVFVISGQPTVGIFQYRTWAPIEGSQKTCVVLSNEGGWATPNLTNTLNFPRLTINIWADPMRDEQNMVTDPPEVMRRAYRTFKVFDRFLHRPGGEDVMFGTLRIISSVRLTEPVIYMVPDGDGLVRCQVVYALTEG